MPRFRPIIQITLTQNEQALAKQDEGLAFGLPCKTEDVIVRLENGVPLLRQEDPDANA